MMSRPVGFLLSSLITRSEEKPRFSANFEISRTLYLCPYRTTLAPVLYLIPKNGWIFYPPSAMHTYLCADRRTYFEEGMMSSKIRAMWCKVESKPVVIKTGS